MGSKKQLFFLVFYDQGSTIHEPIPSPVLVPVPCPVFDQPMSPCADDGKLIPTIGLITTSHKTLGSLMASLFYCRASAAGEVFSQVVQGWEGGTNFSTSQFPRERYLEVPASSPSGLHEQDPRQDRQGRTCSLAKSIITIREVQ
jgi:hypothetical protein